MHFSHKRGSHLLSATYDGWTMHQVLKPEDLPDLDVASLAADLKQLRETQTLVFHSVYVSWGTPLFDRCDQYKLASAKDVALGAEFVKASGELEECNLPDADSLPVELQLQALKKLSDPWVRLAGIYHSTLSSCSARFKDKHGGQLKSFGDRLLTVVRRYDSLLAARFAVEMCKCMALLVEAVATGKVVVAGAAASSGDASKQSMSSYIDSPSLAFSWTYFDKMSLGCMVPDEQKASINALRESRATYRSKVKMLIDEVAVPTFSMLASAALTSFVSDYCKPDNIKNIDLALALCGEAQTQWIDFVTSHTKLRESFLRAACNVAKAVVIEHKLKNFLIDLAKPVAGNKDGPLLDRLPTVVNLTQIAADGKWEKIAAMGGSFAQLHRFLNDFAGVWTTPPIVIMGSTKKEQLPLWLCAMAHQAVPFCVGLADLKAAEIKGDVRVETVHEIAATVARTKTACAFLEQWLSHVQKIGVAPSADNIFMVALQQSGETLQAQEVRITRDCDSALRKLVVDLSEMASSDKVDISSLMDKPARLTASEIEAVKTLWRSQEAKNLLQAECNYNMLKSAVDIFYASSGHPLVKILRDDFQEEHSERILDILRVLAVIALAQACYKTLKQGESRSALIEATLRSFQSNGANVKLPDGVLSQARRTTV
jgi:hypothetical protein